jgi:hypothetical protein
MATNHLQIQRGIEKMSKDYAYEHCLLETAPRLKKRGHENYKELASNLCKMRVDTMPDEEAGRQFASNVNLSDHLLDGTRRSFAMEVFGDVALVDDYHEFPVIAITSGPHDEEGDQKVYIEPTILKDNIEAFNELPVYFNHQRTPDDLLGMAINPEYVELDDGLQAVKLMARIHKDANKANEVLEKIENGDMTHVSIDWLSKDVDVLGEPFATDIRPVEVSFIDNETRTPVCDACTIETKCEEKEVSCDCNGHEEKACTCEHGSTSEVTMTEEVVETKESNPIVEREFAAMKDRIAEMESVHAELTSAHEEALATISKFEEAEELRKVDAAKARVSGFVDAIINKEALLGKVDDENKEERMKELNAWDEIKLEGFSMAIESMSVPEDSERTFGKGKAAEAEAKPEEIDAPETSRMFAMKDGKIVFNGVEQNNKEE